MATATVAPILAAQPGTILAAFLLDQDGLRLLDQAGDELLEQAPDEAETTRTGRTGTVGTVSSSSGVSRTVTTNSATIERPDNMRTDIIRATQNDNGVTWVHVLLLDGVGINLTGATVECHLRQVLDPDDEAAPVVVTSATVTPDADQDANPGRISTVLEAAELATVGTFTVEWQATMTGGAVHTYPSNEADRPRLVIRPEVA